MSLRRVMDELEEELYGSDETGLKPPQSAVAALVRRVGSRAVLERVKTEGKVAGRVFRGFKVGTKALGHSLVQQRLAKELEDHPELLTALLLRWRTDCPQVCAEVEGRTVEALRAELPDLCERWGGGALWLTLAGDGRKTAAQLVRSRQVDWSTPEPSPVSQPAEPETTPEPAATAPEPTPEPPTELVTLREENAVLRKELAREKNARAQAEHEARTWQEKQASTHTDLLTLQEQNGELSRRLDRVERQREKLRAENESLQRELRRLRRLVPEPVEEEPSVKEQVVVAPPPPRRPARKPVPDRVPGLVWKEGARRHAVPMKELLKAVYTNNVSLVSEWGKSLRRLYGENREKFEQLRDAVDRESPYCAFVLCHDTLGVVVDGSNVCHYEHDERGRAKLSNLLAARDYLRDHRFFPILIIVDASLPYQIDDPEGLQTLIERGEVEPVVAGASADDEITRLARELTYYVVSNDRNLTEAIDPALDLPVFTYAIDQGYFYCHEL